MKENDPDYNEHAWVESFKKVNCHIFYWIPFSEQYKTINTNLDTSNLLFKSNTSLFNVMNDTWKNLDEGKEGMGVDSIKNFYEEGDNFEPNSTEIKAGVWSMNNFKKLVCHVSHDNEKLFEHHTLLPKKIPLSSFDPLLPEPDELLLKLGVDSCYKWNPQELLSWYLKDGKITQVQKEHFIHIINIVSCQHRTRTMLIYIAFLCLLPSVYLDILGHPNQQQLLNPTSRDMYLGFVLDKAI